MLLVMSPDLLFKFWIVRVLVVLEPAVRELLMFASESVLSKFLAVVC